ncbi:DUF2203 family protein [Lentzea sp. PSKA42]|uniref:DUF2203 family protein n=1 Tax=Lentzea indica TaxID=2604800 RepID=A0ABX1FDV0_9PSEU|nr:DUF2203 family protein [Lentzea indica]NKE56906.1 DUF2203 family protein [Lentzea indica]
MRRRRCGHISDADPPEPVDADSRNRLRRVRPGNAFVVEEARLAPWSLAHLAPALHLPERKAAKARLNELMAEVQQTGAELKSVAPLLVDFPAELDGMSVLYCWLEGNPASCPHQTAAGVAAGVSSRARAPTPRTSR